MAEASKIEWTDASLTPIRARHRGTGKVGWHCTHATPGCVHCYAEGMNKRLGTGLPFKPGHADQIELFLDEAMLLAPLRWEKPRMIFVCSMTDLFADFVPDEWIDRIFAVIALTPQHTYQVLTKRAARMRDYVGRARERIVTDEHVSVSGGGHYYSRKVIGGVWPWPLPNVWLGVSAEDQKRADERIPDLLATPAAVRFVSAEPLLGPIDFRGMRCDETYSPDADPHNDLDALTGTVSNLAVPYTEQRARLDWIIVGGESGQGARPMHPDWARSIRDQCAAAGTAFFFKQWGEWAPSTPEQAAGNPRSGWRCLAGHPHVARREELYPEAGAAFIEHIGKKAAGRLLDGVQHDAMPEARR